MSHQSPPPDGSGQSASGPNYEDYETQSPPGVPPGPPQGGAVPGGRKKRAYAGQAYEFGQGANVPQQAGPGYSAQQDAAGYPQGGYQQNPTAVQQSGVPMYPQDSGNVGGYQAPAPAYPSQPQQPAPNVGGMSQQFGQMNMSQGQQQPPAPAKAAVLNQLYPTDLSNQPLNVAELDYPPPPAILPANVRFPNCQICLALTSV